MHVARCLVLPQALIRRLAPEGHNSYAKAMGRTRAKPAGAAMRAIKFTNDSNLSDPSRYCAPSGCRQPTPITGRLPLVDDRGPAGRGAARHQRRHKRDSRPRGYGDELARRLLLDREPSPESPGGDAHRHERRQCLGRRAFDRGAGRRLVSRQGARDARYDVRLPDHDLPGLRDLQRLDRQFRGRRVFRLHCRASRAHVLEHASHPQRPRLSRLCCRLARLPLPTFSIRPRRK
jgi:hypothetical protein